MIKSVNGSNVYYKLMWSQLYKYDRYTSKRIIPELSGLIFLQSKVGGRLENLLIYNCWRDGLRIGLTKFLDLGQSLHKDIAKQIDPDLLYFKYTAIDTRLKDIRDIMYWLIQEYDPKFNNKKDFMDSKRYKNIFVDEEVMGKDDIIERRGSR